MVIFDTFSIAFRVFQLRHPAKKSFQISVEKKRERFDRCQGRKRSKTNIPNLKLWQNTGNIRHQSLFLRDLYA